MTPAGGPVGSDKPLGEGNVPLSIRPLHPALGAEIEGLRLREGLDAAQAAAIRATLGRYGVVLLRDQQLSDDELEVFAADMGDPYRMQPGHSAVFRLSNIDTGGNILPENDRARRMNEANQYWHTDSTYLKQRAAISMLHSRIVPATGGDTEFCDTRRAYDDLDAGLRDRIEHLLVRHSLIHSRALTGFDDWTSEQIAALPPIERPLVHVHEETGRKAICLASHICEVVGYAPGEGEELIRMLIERATRPELVYTHRWRAGDLLLWDNRCTMHRARPFAAFSERRDMRSVRTLDLSDSHAVARPIGAAAAL